MLSYINIGLWLIIGILNLIDKEIDKFQYFCVWLCLMWNLISKVII